MNDDKAIFRLNNQEQFIIQTTEPIENFHCCSNAPVIFSTINKQYLVSKHDISDQIQDFRKTLRKAIGNKLQLNKVIKEDIGYFYNQESHKDWSAGYDACHKYWAWSNTDKVRTWLYNDPEGNIILELTPAYPWLSYYGEGPIEEEEGYVTYDEWIKSYKPYVIRTIPQNIAEQWLKQTQYILKHINANLKRMGEEYLARKLAEETEHNEK